MRQDGFYSSYWISCLVFACDSALARFETFRGGQGQYDLHRAGDVAGLSLVRSGGGTFQEI